MSVGNPEKPGGTLRVDDRGIRQIADAMPVLAMRKMKAESLAELIRMAARLRLRQAPADKALHAK